MSLSEVLSLQDVDQNSAFKTFEYINDLENQVKLLTAQLNQSYKEISEVPQEIKSVLETKIEEDVNNFYKIIDSPELTRIEPPL